MRGMSMKKKNRSNEEELSKLDDYYEEDSNDYLYSEVINDDYSDVSYEDFTKPTEVSEEEFEVEEDDEFEDEDSSTKAHSKKNDSLEDRIMDNDNLMDFLTVFWIWFRRIGIILAIIVSAYYLVHGMFKDLFLYLILLVAAYFFGYGFMYLFDHYKENH